MLYASYTHTGGRPCNEDSLCCLQSGSSHCFIVADGLGGHGMGDIASQAAIRSISENWKGKASEKCWTELIRYAHQAVKAEQTPQVKMKTTIVGLIINDRNAVWAHVGDSRLYHFADGKIVFQTEDDSVSALAVQLGEITKEQIRFHESRSSLLKALGQKDGDMIAHTHSEKLDNRKHAFLLCTDGFWEYVTEPEMEKTLVCASSPEQWLAEMRSILQKKAPCNNDNNTAVAIWQ